MSSKKLFYEVVSFRLATALVGLGSDINSAKAGEVLAHLGTLEESDMPPRAAHKIAQDHSKLPEHLHRAGQTCLANLAISVLKDLGSRPLTSA